METQKNITLPFISGLQKLVQLKLLIRRSKKKHTILKFSKIQEKIYVESLFWLLHAKKTKIIQTRKTISRFYLFSFKHLQLSKRPKNDWLLTHFVKEKTRLLGTDNVAFVGLCNRMNLWAFLTFIFSLVRNKIFFGWKRGNKFEKGEITLSGIGYWC